MYSSATLSPSPETAALDATAPELDSFAAFLEKLAQVDLSDALVSPSPAVQDDDASSLSYEHALRRKPVAVSAALAVQEQPGAMAVAEKRNVRTSLCLSIQERDLLRQRASESSLSVSAYVRSCVFEVEMLRAQVKQLMSEMRATNAAEPRVVPDETPVIAAPPKQAALPSPTQTRQLKPATTREPQSSPQRHANPRVQAALEEQRRLSAQQATQKRTHKSEVKPGLFGFLFGARKSA